MQWRGGLWQQQRQCWGQVRHWRRQLRLLLPSWWSSLCMLSSAMHTMIETAAAAAAPAAVLAGEVFADVC